MPHLQVLSMPALARAALAAGLAIGVAGCEQSSLPDSASTGPNPKLPEPTQTVIPTVKIATAKGWPQDAAPKPGSGLGVRAFSRDLSHPRWLNVLPNGDVLVAESGGPPRPEDRKGVKGWIYGWVQKRAGAGAPSPNRIILLRDVDGDGIAEMRTVFLENLNSPFGMVLIGNQLYVANTDAIMRYDYTEGMTEIRAPGTKIADLPGGPLNHHWTKNIIASLDGKRLYATVGSNSNVGENGIDQEDGRAAIWEIDLETGKKRLFATGLRNPNGMAWAADGTLWTVVNERDELGSDLVPDYLTSVKDGGFYGWPYSYWGQHVDARVSPQRPDLVAKAIVPDYALGNHVAALGLAFAEGSSLPEQFRTGAFIGEHGSWNRSPRSGYKVVFVPFSGNKPSGQPVDVLTGFVNDNDEALGRPVGVVIDRKGALLVADDVGNAVWRVTSATPQAASTR
jgi:glucose/arabinose dehydrogenase